MATPNFNSFDDVCGYLGGMLIASADWPAYTHAIDIIDGNNKKNTFTDWHLLPAEPPRVTPPEPKRNMVDVPYSNVPLDYTELNGQVYLNTRTGSWQFAVLPDGTSMVRRERAIMEFIQGKFLSVRLLDYPNNQSVQQSSNLYTTFTGRLWLSAFRSGREYGSCAIDYELLPYSIENRL